MRTFLGMILGALLLVAGVYIARFDVDLVGRQWGGGAEQPHHRELGRRGQSTGMR